MPSKISWVPLTLWFGSWLFLGAPRAMSEELAQRHHPVSESLCLDPIRYVQCFQFTNEECLREADLAVASCIDRLPERPAPPAASEVTGSNVTTADALAASDAGQWGLSLGYCTEETFALWNGSRLAKSEWCADLMKTAANNHNQARYQWERGALRPRSQEQWTWELVQIVLPPLALGLILPLGTFFVAFSLFARKGVRDSRLVWTRNLLFPLFAVGAVLGEIVGHRWNPEVYLSLNPDPSQVAGLAIALLISPIYFVLVWLLHRGLRSELAQVRTHD